MALLAIVAGACDSVENPGEVSRSEADTAFVEAQVFSFPADRSPVHGVILIVGPDSSSAHPFRGPLQSFLTDESGFIHGEVFPPQEAFRDGDPADRSASSPGAAFGDSCVRLIHEGRFSTPRCGVRLEGGRAVNLGAFFVSDFALLPGETTE